MKIEILTGTYWHLFIENHQVACDNKINIIKRVEALLRMQDSDLDKESFTIEINKRQEE